MSGGPGTAEVRDPHGPTQGDAVVRGQIQEQDPRAGEHQARALHVRRRPRLCHRDLVPCVQPWVLYQHPLLVRGGDFEHIRNPFHHKVHASHSICEALARQSSRKETSRSSSEILTLMARGRSSFSSAPAEDSSSWRPEPSWWTLVPVPFWKLVTLPMPKKLPLPAGRWVVTFVKLKTLSMKLTRPEGRYADTGASSAMNSSADIIGDNAAMPAVTRSSSPVAS
mmetsp:Transcript_161778/g.514160  ORF Transcript_161778/g.514160 Transcript_161778/m.514160 type:complete len:224 (+) Transcript_161778:149-820(+)